VTTHAYPYTGHLILAGLFSLAGQAAAITFMVRQTPYTTLVFMSGGAAMIVLGIAVFGYVMFKDVRGRMESISERSFQQGDIVFRQGDPADRVYVLRSGEVEVIREDPKKGETVIARLGEGQYFGEMALLTDAPRNASVRAATDITALTIERNDFVSLFSSIPAFKESIDAVIRQRTQ
jgi:CRP-like cAMP-binding protein